MVAIKNYVYKCLIFETKHFVNILSIIIIMCVCVRVCACVSENDIFIKLILFKDVLGIDNKNTVEIRL